MFYLYKNLFIDEVKENTPKENMIASYETYESAYSQMLMLFNVASRKIDIMSIVKKIVNEIPFKPDSPNWYDVINDKYVLIKDDIEYYYIDGEYVDVSTKEHKDDSILNLNIRDLIPIEKIKESYNIMKFKSYAETELSDESKNEIIHKINSQYVIKVRDFEKPLIAFREYGNKKTGYFEKEYCHFYVIRADGTKYKYSLSDIESYIPVHLYEEFVWEG